jgi:hypothetical protein
VKHPTITQLELVTKIRGLVVRIVERIRYEGCTKNQRGWSDYDADPNLVTVATKPHVKQSHAADMTGTLIHEAIHLLRPPASERWVRKQEGLFVSDDKIRAEAAIRLLNAVFFDDKMEAPNEEAVSS